jgi:hypothetical protein
MSRPSTEATTEVFVTGARPINPDVSKSKNPPMKARMITIQMYFAALRNDCSTGRYLSIGMGVKELGWS